MDSDEQRGDLAAKGWRAGETFFEGSGGKPAKAVGAIESADGISRGDPSLPESEAGTGMIPEDDSAPADDTHLPASEADSSLLEEETGPPAQSWPGGGGPGTIPPPG